MYENSIGGKIAFVTGAGAGIGRAIALRLASEGAHVHITDLNPDWAKKTSEEIVSKGGKASSTKLDVTSRSEVDQAMDSCWQNQGPISFLINNAGVSTMNHIWDLTERDWDFNMNVNAKGVFLVTVSALRLMLKHNYGKEKPKIVNTASMAGKIPGLFLAHYTASKFAVVGFTKDSALELAPYGINVNCVCPGFVKTSMQERELEWEAKLSNKTVEEVRKGYEAQVPLGRLCEPEDVARAVAFLCSSEADYMTGQAINVTGGQVMF
jgi:meso-butanediol dehydrogenase / (S,S)-butanediol dehydrogenase / diacetyl reductase